MDLKNVTIVPKKSPNNPRIPKLSMMNPMKLLFIKINKIPNPKNTVPLILVGLVKKVIVLWGPIIKIIPITNNMLPSAKNPESKNVIIPKIKNRTPKLVNPTPNSFC